MTCDAKKTSLKSSELFESPTNCRLEFKLTLLDKNMRYASRPQLVLIIMCFITYCRIVSLLLCVAVYYDVENMKDPVNIVMNLTNSNLFRMWEIKVSLLLGRFTTKCLVYRVLEQHGGCHEMSQHTQDFCMRELSCSGIQ